MVPKPVGREEKVSMEDVLSSTRPSLVPILSPDPRGPLLGTFCVTWGRQTGTSYATSDPHPLPPLPSPTRSQV